jgi:AcrR family transcriptional regulator
MAETATKRQLKRRASMENLLAAGCSLFVSQGYEQTTVDQIAERAGLTKGAVYFHFDNKEALLLALLDRAETVVVDRMMARLSAAGPEAEAKLVAFVNGQAELGITDPDSVLLLILSSLEFHGTGGPIEARTQAIYGRMYRAIEDVIEFGKRGGRFRTDVPTREQAAIVVAGHDGTFLEWHRRERDLDGFTLVRALRASTLGGLQAGAPQY